MEINGVTIDADDDPSRLPICLQSYPLPPTRRDPEPDGSKCGYALLYVEAGGTGGDCAKALGGRISVCLVFFITCRVTGAEWIEIGGDAPVVQVTSGRTVAGTTRSTNYPLGRPAF